ncbi:MAG: DUF2147 domain-containing protein [Chitinophagia bacterium]|jgi:uncharacterized protein (DUF2147 family)
MQKIIAGLILVTGLFMQQNLLATPSDDVVGVWLNSSGKGKIQIYKENGKYYGKIVWLREPLNEKGQPKLDVNNPNTSQKSKPLVGAIILRDFDFADGEWNNGKIYDPENGKDYKCYMRLKDANTLNVRGYIGISMIGRTEVWTRTKL